VIVCALPRARQPHGICAPRLYRSGAGPGTNGIRSGRIALATIAGELTPILLLVVVVLIYETRGVDPQTRQAFAERVGMWLGPIAGAISTFGFGFLAARGTDRPLTARHTHRRCGRAARCRAHFRAGSEVHSTLRGFLGGENPRGHGGRCARGAAMSEYATAVHRGPFDRLAETYGWLALDFMPPVRQVSMRALPINE